MKIGIITDIHENAEILQEALRQAIIHQCDEMVCLGDIIGFDQRFYRYSRTRSAIKCLALVKSNCRWIVAGNHDLHAAGAFPSYSNGFTYPDNWFELTVEERKRISRGRIWCYEGDEPNDLGVDDLLFLKQLPEHIKLTFNDVTCLFSHNIYPDFTGSTTRFIKRPKHLKEHWDLMHRHGVRFSFCGHFHNFFAGFAYQKAGLFSKAIHSIPRSSFNMGQEEVIIVLPPLAGEKGRASFSIIDMSSLKFNVITVD